MTSYATMSEMRCGWSDYPGLVKRDITLKNYPNGKWMVKSREAIKPTRTSL